MSRRRFYKYRDKKMTKQEKFQWILTSVVFTVVFISVFAYRFVTNCIFEWPIRWDIGICWHEQVEPAKNAAAEKAVNFVP